MPQSLCSHFSHWHFELLCQCFARTAHSLALYNSLTCDQAFLSQVNNSLTRYPLGPFPYAGYGSAGVGRKVQPNLLFRIASISKTVTAVGIMRLVEERKLSLEDRVFGPQGI